ncbi:MAG: S-layer homology domain-containing protein [Clostridia bacterium]|nr:S-layer homology domain-containing protein [Clostridia bacterium]
MKKSGSKILILAICMALLLPCLSVSAVAGEQEIANLLASMSIMNGYPDGELRLEQSVTRAEFSKIAIAASPYKNQVASSLSISPFGDVSYKHWAAPYVKLAVSNSLVTGYPDSTFRPDQTVLLEEAVTVMLKLLGYTNDDFGYSWPYGQLGLAENIGLLDDMSATVGTPMSRRDVMLLTYNLLTCSPKNSVGDYLESIQYKLTEDVVLIATNEEDSSVNPGKVATSAGSYRIDDTFNRSHLGQRGDVIVKNGDTLVCFIPYAQAAEEYVVYSKLDNTIVVYQNGATSQLTLNDGTIVYSGTQKTTYQAIKNTLAMGDLISVQRDSKQNIEYVTVRNGNVVGPVVVRTNTWYQDLSVGSDMTVMRDGVKCTSNDIQIYDVVYYSSDLNMVLAYSKKVTGIYETATPNKDQLTGVTISGISYQVESADAFNALSSNGKFNYGDTVTALLGKDGAIAGVVSADTTDSAQIGYFCGAGVKDYTNQTGETYSNFYIKVAGMDGNVYEYAAKRDYSDSEALNQVVKVSFKDGLASVATYNRQGISGKIDAETRMLGTLPFAESVNILDVVPMEKSKSGAYTSVFLQRLHQMDLGVKQVLYYDLNSRGQITDLILNDVTGECYEYGIITQAESRTAGNNVGGSYSYNIGGQMGSTSTNGVAYNVGMGQPVMLLMNGGRPQNIKPLVQLGEKVTKVYNGYITTAANKEYPLSDKVTVFKKTSYDYTVIPLSELSPEKYTIATYYDRTPDKGGRIRIIVATEK